MAAGTAFEVIPAVDVLGGRAVQLIGGDLRRVTVEAGDAVDAVRVCVGAGARRIHVIDLDGAFGGTPSLDLVRRSVSAAAGALVQVGGGYRTIDAIGRALDARADRVVIGTGAADPAFVADAVAAYGEGVVVALDARDGKIVVDGWARRTEWDPTDLARACVAAGARRFLVTSTARDGTMSGPDLPLLEPLVGVGAPVLAAGGVAALSDLQALRRVGCEGAIVGTAFWRDPRFLPRVLERL